MVIASKRTHTGPKLFPFNLTPAAMRAVHATGRYALNQGAPEALPRHLLLALLEEEEGRAAQLASQAGLVISELPNALGFADLCEASSLDESGLLLNSRLLDILSHAREIAADATGEQAIA